MTTHPARRMRWWIWCLAAAAAVACAPTAPGDYAIQVRTVDPLGGTVGERDGAAYELVVERGELPAGARVVIRLPGVEYPDLSHHRPRVRAQLDGQTIATGRGSARAASATPSRTLWDVPVTLPRTMAKDARLTLAIEDYRLPLRAVEALPVTIRIEDGGAARVVAELAAPLRAGPVAGAYLDAPAAVAAGAAVPVAVTLVDTYGNPSASASGTLTLEIDGRGPQVPIAPGVTTVEVPGLAPGVHRFMLLDDQRERGVAGPVAVVAGGAAPGIYWGDPHSHTGYSDAYTTAGPREAFAFARDVAHLDFAAVTDHAEGIWGEALTAAQVAEAQREATAFNEPGRFVTFFGFEWTASFPFETGVPTAKGHANVIAPGPIAPCRADRAECDELPKLLAHARAADALVIRHHVCVTWAPVKLPEPADPAMPAIEVASSHGNCECLDCPRPPRERTGRAENYVQAALLAGERLGLVAGSDNHHARPGARRFVGRTELVMDAGGVTCVRAAALTREAIATALRERACYATTGARILLTDFAVNGTAMGQTARRADRMTVTASVHGVRALREVVVWRADLDQRKFDIVHRVTPEGADAELNWVDPAPPARGLYYLRARQIDDEMAWSSPIWIE